MELKVLNDSPDLGNTEEFEGKWVQTPKSTIAGKALKPHRSRHTRNLSLTELKYNQNKFSFEQSNVKTRKRKGFKSNPERKEWTGTGRVPRFKCSKKPGFEISVENNISNLKIALRTVHKNQNRLKAFVIKSKTDG